MINKNLGWIIAAILFCANVFQFFVQTDASVTMTHTRDELVVLAKDILVQQRIIADIGARIGQGELITILQRNCELVKIDNLTHKVQAGNMEFVFHNGKLVDVQDINQELLEVILKN